MTLGTFTRVSDGITRLGSKRVVSYDVQLTSGANYTEGGETITPAMVGMGRRIENVLTNGIARATTGSATSRALSFDFATTPGSVKMVVNTTASAEAAASSNQSAFSCRLTFVGK